MRSDAAAQTALRGAADIFAAAAASTDDSEERQDLQVWRLAALASLRSGRSEAEALARELLEAPRPAPGAVHWALHRDIAFNASSVGERLRSALSGAPDPERAIALAAVLVAEGARQTAIDMLREQSARIERPEGGELLQDWIGRLLGRSQTDINHAIRLGAEEGRWAALEAVAADERAPLSDRALALRVLAEHDRWTAVRANTGLLEAFQTAEATRVAAYARSQTGDWSGALELLTDREGEFLGEELPEDLEQIRITALIRAGRTQDAVRRLEGMPTRGVSDRARVFDLQTRLQLGDLEGAAAQLPGIDAGRLDPVFRVQVAERLAVAAPALARQLLRTVPLASVDVSVLPLAFSTAHRLGLDATEHDIVLRRLLGPEGQSAGVSQAFTLEEALAFLRSPDRQAAAEAFERGEAPIHAVMGPRLGTAFVPLLAGFGPASELWGRSGGQVEPRPFAKRAIVLDVTGALVAHALGLFDLMLRTYTVEVSTWLGAALAELETALDSSEQHASPAPAQRLLRLVDQGVLLARSDVEAFRAGAGPGVRGSDILDRLEAEGQLDEARRADLERAHPALRELGETTVAREGGAIVLDDELALVLADAGLLETVAVERATFIDPRLPERLRASVNAHSARRAAAAEVRALRQRVVTAIREGELRVLPSRDPEPSASATALSVIDVLEAAGPDRPLWVEDRALDLAGEAASRNVFDLLSDWRARGDVSDETVQSACVRLREAGYRLLPIPAEEVIALLRAAPVKAGRVMETQALGAVRRAFAADLRRERAWRLGPIGAPGSETRWALAAFRLFDAVLRRIWNTEVSVERREAWSAWAHKALRCDQLRRVPVEQAEAKGRRVLFTVGLIGHLSLPVFAGKTPEDRKAATAWVWSSVIAPELEADPSLRETLARGFREFWTGPLVDEIGVQSWPTADEQEARIGLCGSVLAAMPEPMRELVLSDPETEGLLSRFITRRLVFDDWQFRAEPVLKAVAEVAGGAKERRIVVDQERLRVFAQGSGVAIRRLKVGRTYGVDESLLALVVGSPAALEAAAREELLTLELVGESLEKAVARVTSPGEPFQRLVRLNRERETTVLGRLAAIGAQARRGSINLDSLLPPPPEAFTGWVCWDEEGAPDVPATMTKLGNAAWERLAGAPLRGWRVLAEEGASPLAGDIDEVLRAAPLGELLALQRVISDGSDHETIRDRSAALIERFATEGEAFVTLVSLLVRAADADAEWRAAADPGRVICIWMWADQVWRALSSAGLDPTEVVFFFSRQAEERPRDFTRPRQASAAPPWLSSSRLLACGLSLVLGDQGRAAWCDDLAESLSREMLKAREAGDINVLAHLANAADANALWLAASPSILWSTDLDELQHATAEAAAGVSDDPARLPLIVMAGPDALTPETARRLIRVLAEPAETGPLTDVGRLRALGVAAASLARQQAITSEDDQPLAAAYKTSLNALRADPEFWSGHRGGIERILLEQLGDLPPATNQSVLIALMQSEVAPELSFRALGEVLQAGIPLEERLDLLEFELLVRTLDDSEHSIARSAARV